MSPTRLQSGEVGSAAQHAAQNLTQIWLEREQPVGQVNYNNSGHPETFLPVYLEEGWVLRTHWLDQLPPQEILGRR